MKNTNKKGFTLVEIIVVITILVILGAIAFISLNSYSRDSRNSARISDISRLKTSLELFNVDAGIYPLPNNGTTIIYSGGVVWTQGTFSEGMFANVKALNKIPTDPLIDKEYTYSLTNHKNEFQVAGILEGDLLGFNPTIPITNASDIDASAYVSGNYNGIITKSITGATDCRLLATPSIITSDLLHPDLQYIVDNNLFVYTGFSSLPSSFTGSRSKKDQLFNFNTPNLIVYSDTGSCLSLIDNYDNTSRVELLRGIQRSYTGTILADVGELKKILSLVITDSGAQDPIVEDYACNFVNNSLGKNKIKTCKNNSTGGSGGGSFSCNIIEPLNAVLTAGTATSLDQIWQNTNSGSACYYECNSGFTGSYCSDNAATVIFFDPDNSDYTCPSCN